MSAYAIIPARGGSRGVPGKNLRKVAGIPLVARAVHAARAAAGVSKVFVSTDDAAIAQCARQWGAEVIERPAHLASDTASSESALLHACQQWSAEGSGPDTIVFLQATSPFTTAEHIDGALTRLVEAQADVVVGVVPFHRFQWQGQEDGTLAAVGHDKYSRPRRQDLAERFVESGSLYVMRTAGFVESGFRFFGRVVPFPLPEHAALEIDSPLDLTVACAVAPGLAAARPAFNRRVRAAIFDFDGVMTDDKVYVDETGRETVRASRSDGMGLARLRRAGVSVLVLSSERNGVVARRCEKLAVDCLQAIDDKLPALQRWLAEAGLTLDEALYVGNDVNDLECLEACAIGVAVADAHVEVLAVADVVLSKAGGDGAVREVCDWLLTSPQQDQPSRR